MRPRGVADKYRPLTPNLAMPTPGHSVELLQGRFKVSHDRLLGEGTYARVCKGLDVHTNKEVAVKMYIARPCDDEWDTTLQQFFHSVRSAQLLSAGAQGALVEGDTRTAAVPSTAKRGGPRGRMGMRSMMPSREANANNRCSFANHLIEDDCASHAPTGMFRRAESKIPNLDLTECFVKVIAYSEQAGVPGLDVEADRLYLILELGADSMEELLAEHAAEGTILSLEELRWLQWGLVSIVCGLHAAGFVHMNIKPSHVVRFGDRWKLIDFDGAVKSGTRMQRESLTWTPYYMAPETAGVLIEEEKTLLQVSRLMDVWSVGLCALEAVFLQPVLKPWYDEWKAGTGDDLKFLGWLADYTASPAIMDGEMCDALQQIHPDMASLLQGMLVKDPAQRSDIAECLVHPWFEPIRVKVWKGMVKLADRSTRAEQAQAWSSDGSSTRSTRMTRSSVMSAWMSEKATAKTCAVM